MATNLAQHCATSRRTDFDDALRDLPGMEVGNGTVQRQPLQPIYRCLSSTLPDYTLSCLLPP